MPPGGALELGESLEDALIREMREETELEVRVGRLLWVHEFLGKPFHAVEFYFRCHIIGGQLKLGGDPELEGDNPMLLDLSFVPFEETGTLAIEPNFVREFCESGANDFKEVRHIVSEQFS